MVELRSGKQASSDNFVSAKSRSKDGRKPDKKKGSSKAPARQTKAVLDKKAPLRVKKKTTSTIPKKRSNSDDSSMTFFYFFSGAKTGRHDNDVDDKARKERKPTPGRIINPREVNENGASPLPSKGDPKDWPNIRDKDYCSKSYTTYDENWTEIEHNEGRPFPPPPKKGRRTNAERDKHAKFEATHDPNARSHDLYLCYGRGPRGKPTYDRAGFLLDYDKVSDWFKPRSRASLKPTQKSERAIFKSMADSKKMLEFFFEPGAAPEDRRFLGHCQDRVSKDIGVPWHKVGIKEFEEWVERGFTRAKRGEYECDSFTSEEMERELKLLQGASHRK